MRGSLTVMASNRTPRDAPSSRLAMGAAGLVAVLLAIWVLLRLVRAVFYIVKIGVVLAAVAFAAIAISKALGKRDR